MGTPDFVKFSRIPGQPADAYRALAASLFPAFNIRPRDFVHLQRSNDPYHAGLEEHGERIQVTDNNCYAELAHHAPLFGSSHEIPYVPAYLYLHFFDQSDDGCGITTCFDTSLVYYANSEYEPGQWLMAMLSRLTAILGAQVCGYGPAPAYDVAYESLSAHDVVARLRSGEILDIWYPTFHAISTDLISPSEVRALMASRNVTLATRDLRFGVGSGGYNLIWNLP